MQVHVQRAVVFQGVHLHGGRDRAGGVVHGDVDGEILPVALRHVGGGGAVDGGGHGHLRVRVGPAANRDDARREDGNVLVQIVRDIPQKVRGGAILRTRAVSDAVVGVAEGTVGDRFVGGGVHAFAAGHLGEAVVAVEPLRAVGQARLGAAVGDVVTGKNSVHNVQFFNHFSSSYTRMKFLKSEDEKRAERR